MKKFWENTRYPIEYGFNIISSRYNFIGNKTKVRGRWQQQQLNLIKKIQCHPTLLPDRSFEEYLYLENPTNLRPADPLHRS